MKLKHLLTQWTNQNTKDCEIQGIQNDSRLIKPGDLFLAYKGTQNDGRSFISQAISQGASAIAYDPLNCPPFENNQIPLIPIPQLITHLSEIAKRFYNNPGEKLKITGITGTNGKTTIAYQLAQAHHLLGQKSAYIGTIGQGEITQLNPLNNTTPDIINLLTLFDAYRKQGIHQVCMEVSSHALSQNRVEGIEFKQAVFTNLTLDHLDYHHSMEDYAKAKAKLFARPELEWVILNQDDEFYTTMLHAVKPQVKKLTYGLGPSCDVKAEHWQMDVNGTSIEVHTPWGKHELKIKALGQFNIYNTLAVLSSLLASGFPPSQITKVIEQLKPAPGRMEVVLNAPYVVVDYAHTPDALEKVLSTLSQLKKGQLWVIFGCGGDRDKSKRPIMGKTASLFADKIIITSDNPRTEDPGIIIEEVANGIPPGHQVTKLENREDAIAYALNSVEKEDIILIAGKGHETYQQIGTIKHPFSDQEVVRRLMEL